MDTQKEIKNSSSAALFGSLKETFLLGVQEAGEMLGSMLATPSNGDKNQISTELQEREKELQESRLA